MKKTLPLFVLFFLGTLLSFGQTNTWTGAGGASWDTASSWSLGIVPIAAHDVVIPNVTNQPAISVAGAVCSTLKVTNTVSSSTNTLTVTSPGTLAVSGAITIDAPLSGSSSISAIDVSTGTLTAAAMTMSYSNNVGRSCKLLIGAGTVNVAGNITMSSTITYTNITFTGSGTLNVGGTISAGGITPGTGTINYNNLGAQTVGGYSYNNLILSGSGVKTLPTSFTILGDLTLSGTAAATTAANLAVLGNLNIGSGTNLTTGNNFTLGVTGTTDISGALTLGGTAAKTFSGNTTINTGGVWSETAVAVINYGGNLTNKGSFTANTGAHNFTGSAKTIGVSGSTINITNIAIAGTYSNLGNLYVTNLSGSGALTNSLPASTTLGIGGSTSITTLTNNATLNINGSGNISTSLANFTNTGVLNLAGTGTIAGITNNSGGIINLVSSGTVTALNNATATSVLNISALTVPTITTLTATAVGNTVNYTGAGAQTVKATTYDVLNFTGSGSKTLAGATTANGTVTVNSGVSLNIAAQTLTLNGDLVNSGGSISGTTGSVTLAGTNNQNIAGFTTAGTVRLSKTAGTATLTGNVAGGILSINATSGTGILNMGTGLTHSFVQVDLVSGASGTLDGGSSTINVTGTTTSDWKGTGARFTASTSTVNMSGAGTQTVSASATTFYNLILSNTGTKVISNATTVSNNWSIATGVVASLLSNSHTSSTLTLGGFTTPSGTWGSTSSSAINKSNTFFTTANTGIITVSNPTCTLAVYTMTGTGGVLCGTATPFPIGLSNSEVGVSYQLLKDNIAIGTAMAGTGGAIGFGDYTNNGTYTVFATRTATFCTATMTGSVIITVYSMPPTPTAITTDVSCPINATGTITVTNALSPASLKFTNSSNNYVDLGSKMLSNLAKFTVEGWIKYDNANYVNRMSLFGQNDVIEFGFQSNTIFCWTSGAGIVSFPIASYPTDKGWHHIAATGDGTKLILYLDGVQMASLNNTTTNYGSDTNYTTKIGWGVVDPGAQGFTGEILKVGFWNKAFSSTEISTLAGGFIEYDSAQSGLLAGYNFNEGTGAVLSSVGSLNSSGALTSSPTGSNPVWTDPYTYSWTSVPAGFTSSTKNLTALQPKTYNLTTSLKGCTNSGSWSVNATNTESVAPTSIGGTNVICNGSSTTLTLVGGSAGTGATAQWFTGSCGGTSAGTGNSITVSPTSNTTYYVRYSGTCNTTSCVSQLVTVSSNNTISLTSAAGTNSQTVCASSAITTITYSTTGATGATVTGLPTGVSGVWSGNVVTISGTPTVSGAAASYTVTLTGGCGTITATGTITVNYLSVAPTGITGTTTICNGSSTTLTLSGGTAGTAATVGWFTGSCGGTIAGTGNSITVSPASNTTYYVRYTGACNTTSCASQIVTVNALLDTPTIDAITQPTCVVATGSVALSGLPSGAWSVSTNPVTGTTTGTGTTATIAGLSAGTSYTFRVLGTCPSAQTTSAVINPVPSLATWNGTAWTGTSPIGSSPTLLQPILFTGNYSSTGSINGCSCSISSGNVVVNSGHTMTITNAVNVTNAAGSSLTFNDSASLVQTNNVTNTGNIIYKRSSQPMKNFDFTYWSSPVDNQTAVALSPNTLSDKYFRFDAALNNWVFDNGKMTAGVGFIIRTPKAGTYTNGELVSFPYSQPVSFIGVPNNGNYKFDIGENQYNLIGNPYPSAISADLFMTDTNNASKISGALYFWTHNTGIAASGSIYVYSSDDYATYNLTGGTGTQAAPSNTSGTIPNGQIAAGQSFFVGNTDAGSFMFNNSMRLAGSNTQFFKFATTQKSSSIEKNRLWLSLANSGGAFKQLLIGYISGATNNYDNLFDGPSFDGNAYIDFYSLIDDVNCTIQGRSLPFDVSDQIPLGYKSTIAGSFTINIDQTDGLLSNQAIYLEDKLMGTTQNLKDNSYSFKTTIGTFDTRFVLKYANKTLGINDIETEENQVVVSVKNRQIKINATNETLDKVMIYDSAGRLIYQKNDINNSLLEVSNFTTIQAVFVVKVTLESGKIVTKKIIVK